VTTTDGTRSSAMAGWMPKRLVDDLVTGVVSQAERPVDPTTFGGAER
jgi:hypothetical protein